MSTQRPVFIVTSGRTGSTLLAKMINRHPAILCASDIFEPVGDNPFFEPRVVNGKEFFRLLSKPSHPARIRFWRQQPTDELLFLHPDDQHVSLLLSYTLPFLTGGSPMSLYEEVKEHFRQVKPRQIPDHLLLFFDWLRDRYQKSLWVERTGGSLPHTKKIIDTWPSAKVVFYYRDPRETAISMMHNDFFRLYLELTKKPALTEWDSDFMPPIGEMAAMLNTWTLDAMAALSHLQEDRVFTLRYEDLVATPEKSLISLVKFCQGTTQISEAEFEWARKEARIIRNPVKRFLKLPTSDQDQLLEACGALAQRLGYGSTES
jgi:hypothetical protein